MHYFIVIFRQHGSNLHHPVAINSEHIVGLNVGLEIPIVAFGEDLKMLTELKARALKADDKPVRVGGVAGLYLRPGSKTGSGRYILRFVSPETGKRRDMGLGTYPETSLADARIRGIEVRR